MSDEEFLVCPNRGEEIVRLVEVEDDDEWVECLRCEEVYPNVLRYPVQLVHTTTTGRSYLKNVLTGEIIEPGEEDESNDE